MDTSNPLPESNDPETYAIIGAAMAVHTEKGCGFLEPVYHEALSIELRERNNPFLREVRFPISYREYVLPVVYTVDFLCDGSVIVEVKALRAIGPIEEAQAINYLRAGNCQRGLVLNFGGTSLQHKRIVWSRSGDAVKRP